VRLAFLADAHGNSVGLAACLERIAAFEVAETYFLGDAVGYLSDPQPALRLLAGAGVKCQKGNHEAMLLGGLPLDPRRDAFYRLDRQRAELPPERLEELSAWPVRREIACDGARLLLSHGSPSPSLEERVHEDTPWQPGPDFAFDGAFIGHTHRPFVRRVGDVLLVNVGSCGLPRDRGDLAAFVIYDGQQRAARIYRVPFDVERALALHGAGVPDEVRAVFARRGPFHGEVV
jgi:predicted phosphodiesterase